MFQTNSASLSLHLEHRHNDGSWSPLEARPSRHDAAEFDPERAWATGRVFACTTCDEQVRVTDLPSDSDRADP
jgi:hypothetical protein